VLRGISASEKTEKLRQNLDAIKKMHDEHQRLYHEQFKNCSKMDVLRKIVEQGTGKYKDVNIKKSQLQNIQIGLRFYHPKKRRYAHRNHQTEILPQAAEKNR
jgi:citrate synthase